MLRISAALVMCLALAIPLTAAAQSDATVNEQPCDNFQGCLLDGNTWEICSNTCPYNDKTLPHGNLQEVPSLTNPFDEDKAYSGNITTFGGIKLEGIWVPSPAELYLDRWHLSPMPFPGFPGQPSFGIDTLS